MRFIPGPLLLSGNDCGRGPVACPGVCIATQGLPALCRRLGVVENVGLHIPPGPEPCMVGAGNPSEDGGAQEAATGGPAPAAHLQRRGAAHMAGTSQLFCIILSEPKAIRSRPRRAPGQVLLEIKAVYTMTGKQAEEPKSR